MKKNDSTGIKSLFLYVWHALIFPFLIRDLRFNLKVYKDVANFIKQKIAEEGAFKNFLDAHNFQEDSLGLGRLYSVQNINESLANNLSDADLNYTVREKLAKEYEFLANQGFIEILLMKTERIDRTTYVLILEIANFAIIKSILYHMLFALGLWAFLCRIVWVFFNPQVLYALESIKSFFIHIF